MRRHWGLVTPGAYKNLLLFFTVFASQLNKADPEGTFSLEQAERFAKGLPTEPPDIEDIEDYADFALPSVDEEEDDPLGHG